MSDVIISVRGEHEARLAPERGTVHFSVRADGPERGPVVERIASPALPLREQLDERKDAGAVTEWTSRRVSVWSDRPWNAEGTQLPLVHHASIAFTATFSDFAVLSWWVGDVAEAEGVQLENVTWALTPERGRVTESEVAAEAVRTAVTRATSYATAIGLSAVTPLEIADVGLLARTEAESGFTQSKMIRAASMDAMGGGVGVQLQPDDIVVTAAVEARFLAR